MVRLPVRVRTAIFTTSLVGSMVGAASLLVTASTSCSERSEVRWAKRGGRNEVRAKRGERSEVRHLNNV